MIALSGRLTVSALAISLKVGRPAASQIATELETSAWLVRQSDEQDHRRVWLSIAADRREEIESYCRRRVEPLLKVLASMAAPDQAAFLAGLEHLLEEIESNGI